MLEIEFRFDRKMRPKEESCSTLLLLKIYGGRSKNYESQVPTAAQCLLLKLALIPCYFFIIQASIMNLGSLTERITSTAIKHKHNTRDKRHKELSLGRHKGENPTTSSEIESAPKVKLEKSKMISRQQQSLSLILRELLLSHSCAPMSECEYEYDK